MLSKDKLTEREKSAQKLIGKCFSMPSSAIAEYFKVEKVNLKAHSVTGVRLAITGRKPKKGGVLNFKKCKVVVSLNQSMWDRDLDGAMPIKQSKFNRYMKRFHGATQVISHNTIRENLKVYKPSYANFTDKMKKIMPSVMDILRTDADARDDDNLLCCLVWKRQGAKENTSFRTFRKKLLTGKFSLADTITRSRRHLQLKNAHLRGKLYAERHEQEKLMKNQFSLDFDYIY